MAFRLYDFEVQTVLCGVQLVDAQAQCTRLLSPKTLNSFVVKPGAVWPGAVWIAAAGGREWSSFVANLRGN